MMQLFSDGQRIDVGAAGYSSRDYAYLDRSARPIAERLRQILEGWFADYPENAKEDLYRRFTSSEEHQHLGALLELHTHATLRRAGYDVEPHPDIPNQSTHPDFAASIGGSVQMFVECVMAMDSVAAIGASRRRAEVIDTLNQLQSDQWSFSFVPLVTGPASVNRQQFLRDVRKWISTLQPVGAAEGLRNMPKWHWRKQGWLIQLIASPLRAGARPRGARGMVMSEMVRSDAPRRVRGRLKEKFGAYGEDLGAPFVVVASTGLWHANEVDLMNALVDDGDWDIRSFGRHRRGLWITGERLRAQHVSGVLYTPQLGAWSMADAPWLLVEHPAPVHLVPAAVFSLAARVTWRPEGTSQRSAAASTFRDLHGLPADWPNPD